MNTARQREMSPFRLGRKAKPTKQHRLAIWENMLGTVYAMNDAGDVQYFDYRWADAIEFAGATTDRDPRLATPRVAGRRGTNSAAAPRLGQTALWITETTTNEGATS